MSLSKVVDRFEPYLGIGFFGSNNYYNDNSSDTESTWIFTLGSLFNFRHFEKNAFVPFVDIGVGYLNGEEAGENKNGSTYSTDISSFVVKFGTGIKYFISESAALSFSLSYSKYIDYEIDTKSFIPNYGSPNISYDVNSSKFAGNVGLLVYF